MYVRVIDWSSLLLVNIQYPPQFLKYLAKPNERFSHHVRRSISFTFLVSRNNSKNAQTLFSLGSSYPQHLCIPSLQIARTCCVTPSQSMLTHSSFAIKLAKFLISSWYGAPLRQARFAIAWIVRFVVSSSEALA